MKRALVIALLAACGVDEDTIEINLAACKEERISKYLPLGSVWIDVKPLSKYVCQLTLGGETENPNYDGSAAQSCVFIRSGSISVDVRSGGPAYIDSSSCVDR